MYLHVEGEPGVLIAVVEEHAQKSGLDETRKVDDLGPMQIGTLAGMRITELL